MSVSDDNDVSGRSSPCNSFTKSLELAACGIRTSNHTASVKTGSFDASFSVLADFRDLVDKIRSWRAARHQVPDDFGQQAMSG